jgi:hypothetical protein|nr:MAG TPA: Lower collar protein [Caudoviricetes sp.]
MANYTMTIGEMMTNDLCKNIFPKDYPFYIDDETLRKAFEEKFIAHYYYREIGYETPFMFIQRLESFLNLRMPYYAKLYETELEAKKINFMLNKDLQETFIRELSNENNLSGETSSNQSGTGQATTQQSTDSNNNHKESALSDGVSAASLSDGYLTGVSQDNGTATTDATTNTTDTINATSSSSQTTLGKQTEKTELISQGNIGVTSSAQLLKEWREVILNIDELIIKDCSKLFMSLY